MKGVLKVFVCNDFVGHFPTGSAAVIVATSEKHARALLGDQLRARGLDAEQFTVRPLDASKAGVEILHDGNY